MQSKKNLQHCLEQQSYASQENFTQQLVVMVETFRRSAWFKQPIKKEILHVWDSTGLIIFCSDHLPHVIKTL